jgi:hypothetical protein
MADLTPAEERLGEVLGLAQAARGAAAELEVEGRGGGVALRRMRAEALETERLCFEVAAKRGKRAAILARAQETRRNAVEMMRFAYSTMPASSAESSRM